MQRAHGPVRWAQFNLCQQVSRLMALTPTKMAKSIYGMTSKIYTLVPLIFLRRMAGQKGKSGVERPLFQKTLITNKPA